MTSITRRSVLRGAIVPDDPQNHLPASLDRQTGRNFKACCESGCRSYFDPLAFTGALHTKLSASFVLPTPL